MTETTETAEVPVAGLFAVEVAWAPVGSAVPTGRRAVGHQKGDRMDVRVTHERGVAP